MNSVGGDSGSGSAVETPAQSVANEESETPALGAVSMRERAIGELVDGPLSRYPAGTSIGRYVVLSALGAGGMGAVLSAYDPELDRRVALKILRASRTTSEADQQRLLREARALAKLSHPNVVQVHDVGAHERDIFVAMEFVEGWSIKEWCRTPRSWQEVRAAYIEAGRGLAAAHDKGLIHRDVKPANLLCGDDGRVRVADFGLAVPVERDAVSNEELFVSKSDVINTAQSLSGTVSETWSESPHGSQLTQTGALLGTPSYMAPEQHTSANVGPLADQYSFCVSLYQSLYGRLPFVPEEPTGRRRRARRTRINDILAKKLTGQIPDPPADSDVPEWLHKLVARGLRVKPDERFPSMHALIGALRADPAARRRARIRVVLAGTTFLALVTLLIVVMSQRRVAEGPRPVCHNLDRELAGVWDPLVAEQVRAGFLSTGLSYAGDTFDRTSTILQAYAYRWVNVRVAACRATHVHKTQPEDIMGLRMYCLDRRRSQLSALVDVLRSKVDTGVVSKAVMAARELPDIDYCSDIEALTARVPPPEETAERARVEDLQLGLDHVRALLDSGRYREGLERGKALSVDMSAIEYPPVRAQLAYTMAVLHQRNGDYGQAEALYRDAMLMSARARDDVAGARAWSDYILLIGTRLARHEDAINLVHAAQVAVERADDDLARGKLENSQGGVFISMGKYEEARVHFERGHNILVRALGPDHPRVAPLLNNLGITGRRTGRYDEARAMYERAIEVIERALGPDHPDLALSNNNLGSLALARGDFAEARERYLRALSLRRQSLDPKHPMIASSVANLGILYSRMGRYERALERYRESLAIRMEALGAEHPQVARTEQLMAQAEVLHGRPESASERLRPALDRMIDRLGDEHRYVAAGWTTLAHIATRTGAWQRADELAQRALATLQKTRGQDHVAVAAPLLVLAENAELRGRTGAARGYYERALSVSVERRADQAADSKFGLARVLWPTVEHRPQARMLAAEAAEFYQAIEHVDKRAAVAAWLQRTR